MAGISSYLKDLPPVLWENDPAPPAYSLSTALKIFEKLLTGIDDGNSITHGNHRHDSFEAVIDRIPRLFQPWTTPADFLPWLASWVALEFPDLWDEYQRRKITSQIVQIYQRRGLKDGLNQYFDLYTVASTRPRIAVDDCSKVLMTKLQSHRFAPLTTIDSQGPFQLVNQGLSHHEGLVAPLSIARGADSSLFVGDGGTPLTWTGPHIKPGVWRFSPPGEYVWSGAPPVPQRLAAANFQFPIALVVDQANPWNLWVLDRNLPPGSNALFRVTSPNFAAAVSLATNTQLGLVWPVAMALDLNGHLLILDRGKFPGNPATPKIIDVNTNPFGTVSHNLAVVMEPLSLLVQPNGLLVVGDAREQAQPTPADLIRVDRANAWAETRLLSGMAAGTNPLLAPTAAVQLAISSQMAVLDVGLKSFYLPPANPYLRQAAEQASVYLVDVAPNPPTVTLATEQQELVFPTGMVASGDALYISDRGDYSDPQLAGPLIRVWRALTNELGVTIHFSLQRPTTQLQRRQIVNDVYKIASQHRPAKSLMTFAFEV
jgi:phage tail-like protein